MIHQILSATRLAEQAALPRTRFGLVRRCLYNIPTGCAHSDHRAFAVPLPLVVTHERRDTWARQLRPRAVSWGHRLVETRSAADLARTLRRADNPLVLVDLGQRPIEALEALANAVVGADEPLVLVLDPNRTPGIQTAALELGATEIWSGPVAPPRVVNLLERWAALTARRRARPEWRGEVLQSDDPIGDLIRAATQDFASGAFQGSQVTSKKKQPTIENATSHLDTPISQDGAV